MSGRGEPERFGLATGALDGSPVSIGAEPDVPDVSIEASAECRAWEGSYRVRRHEVVTVRADPRLLAEDGRRASLERPG